MKRTKTNQPSNYRVLACDPSMTAWGWAIVDENAAVIDFGTIKTESTAKKLRIRKGDSTVARISEINKILLGVIRKHKVKHIVSELPHGSQNASAAVMIGATAAIVQTLSDILQLPIDWFSEQDAKKEVLGKKSATKQEMIDTMAFHYQGWATGIKFRDESVADALAVYYTACRQSQGLKAVLNYHKPE